MSELIIPSERVRGLTSAPRRIPIDIEGSVTYEIVHTVTGLICSYTYSDMTGAALNAQINPQ